MLVHSILSQRSLSIPSIFFHSFPLILLCSSYFHHSICQFTYLFLSSVILVLVPSRVFLISVIMLFISLLILYFFYILGNCINYVKCFLDFLHSDFESLEQLYYHYSELFCRSFYYFLFIWTCVFLDCAFICTVFLYLFIIFKKFVALEVSFFQTLRLNSFIL